jgi:hypothetical protein
MKLIRKKTRARVHPSSQQHILIALKRDPPAAAAVVLSPVSAEIVVVHGIHRFKTRPYSVNGAIVPTVQGTSFAG